MQYFLLPFFGTFKIKSTNIHRLKNFINLLLLLAFSFSSIAQEKWDLQKCLRQAKENNLEILKQKLLIDVAKSNLKSSKLSLLPNFNAFSSQGYNFGRAIDPLTNDFTIENISSNNFSLSSSVDLFDGFNKINKINRDKNSLKFSELELERLVNRVYMDVIDAYLQIIFCKELVGVSKQQLNITKLQYEKSLKLYNEGVLARDALLQVESQVLSEKLAKINSENQLELAKLNLQQFLKIEQSEDFEIQYIKLNIDTNLTYPKTSEIYRLALNKLPEVKAAEQNIQISKKNISITKSNLLPKLSFSSSIGTGYSSARTSLFGEQISFKTQIEDNLSQSISFNLSFPIFNGNQIRNLITSSKIDLLNSNYVFEETKFFVRKQIEIAYSDFRTAKKQYQFCMKSVVSNKQTFTISKNKYDLGIIDTFSFLETKSRLNKAESELVRAKYDYVFKSKILDYYMGKNLNL